MGRNYHINWLARFLNHQQYGVDLISWGCLVWVDLISWHLVRPWVCFGTLLGCPGCSQIMTSDGSAESFQRLEVFTADTQIHCNSFELRACIFKNKFCLCVYCDKKWAFCLNISLTVKSGWISTREWWAAKDKHRVRTHYILHLYRTYYRTYIYMYI